MTDSSEKRKLKCNQRIVKKEMIVKNQKKSKKKVKAREKTVDKKIIKFIYVFFVSSIYKADTIRCFILFYSILFINIKIIIQTFNSLLIFT